VNLRAPILLVALLCCISFLAFSQNSQYKTRVLFSKLDTPWEITPAPDGSIWISLRPGIFLRGNLETGALDTLLDMSDRVVSGPEGGLLGFTFHPRFPDSPFVYTTHTMSTGGFIEQTIIRLTYANDTLIDPTELVRVTDAYTYHAGARLKFGPDDKLYVCVGDATRASTPQDLNLLPGKILRMNTDGSVPDDNPFPNSLVYALGVRNPQGMVFTPEGELYTAEHGPDNDDEVNHIRPAGNYGWPNVVGPADTDEEKAFQLEHNTLDPFYTSGERTYGMGSLDYYPYDNFPELKGKLLLTSLKAARIQALNIIPGSPTGTSDEPILNFAFGRIRDLAVLPNGRILFCTSNRDGKPGPGFPLSIDDQIYELLPADEGALPAIDPQPRIDTLYVAERDTVLRTINLYNSGTALASIRDWEMVGEHTNEIYAWRFEPGTWIAPGKPCPFPIWVTPMGPGPRTARLRLNGANPQVVVEYSIVVITDFVNLDFADKTVFVDGVVGAPTTFATMIENKSDEDVTVMAAEFSGEYASEYTVKSGQFPFTLKAGESRILDLEFRPAATGVNRTAELRLRADRPLPTVLTINGQALTVNVLSAAPLPLLVTPNPAQDVLTVRLPDVSQFTGMISLNSITGQSLLTHTIDVGSQSVRMPLENIAPGPYVISCRWGPYSTSTLLTVIR
jgi:glucose/arabinose dehydrogenase